MQKIKFTLLVGLVVLMVAMFMGCEPSLEEAKEPDRYVTLQLLKPGTDTVVHTFNLELSVPNFKYIRVTGEGGLEHTNLTYSNIIERYEPTTDPKDWIIISTEFYFTIASRTIEYNDNSMPSTDLTMIELGLKDFQGIGTYTFDEDDLTGYFWTDHLGSNNKHYFCDSADGGYITITEYGEVGGVISGSAFLENAKLEYYSNHEEDLTFDIKANFSLKRDNDCVIKMRKLTYIISGENAGTIERYKQINKATGLISATSNSDGKTFDIPSWNTEPDGSGEEYLTNILFIMPDEDITLYATVSDD